MTNSGGRASLSNGTILREDRRITIRDLALLVPKICLLSVQKCATHAHCWWQVAARLECVNNVEEFFVSIIIDDETWSRYLAEVQFYLQKLLYLLYRSNILTMTLLWIQYQVSVGIILVNVLRTFFSITKMWSKYKGQVFQDNSLSHHPSVSQE